MGNHWSGVEQQVIKLEIWLDPTNSSGGSLNGRNSCVAGLDDVHMLRKYSFVS